MSAPRVTPKVKPGGAGGTTGARYPRELAVRVLTAVLSDREPLDEALERIAVDHPAARAWLQEVCSGTLRWMPRLELAIDSGALKKKPSGWLRKMLLIAAYQLVAQDRTSPTSVVFETVEEIKRREGEAPSRFANALLRKVSDHSRSWRELEYPIVAAGRAQWACLPEWFWKKLVQDRGEEWARAFALACLERPRTWARTKMKTKDSASTPTSLGEPGPVAGSVLLSSETGGPVTERPEWGSGNWIVQDISSQMLVAEISRHAREVAARPRVLDLCAAPGGKSIGLAWSGTEVHASDRDARRMELLRQSVSRAAPEVTVHEPSAIDSLSGFDLVWVDAPCTGSGIIRRHPDVRWLRQPRDLESLARVQKELLEKGWSKVRPGGLLAWSVCSVFSDEGERLIERAGLAEHVVSNWLLAPQLEPFGDGFWAVLLKKPANLA